MLMLCVIKNAILQQSVTEVRAVIGSQFEKLHAVMLKAKKEVTEILEGEHKQAMKQVEGIQVHLEQRCTELKKNQAQMEKLSRNKNDVDFLQVRSQEQNQLYCWCRILWDSSALIQGFTNIRPRYLTYSIEFRVDTGDSRSQGRL